MDTVELSETVATLIREEIACELDRLRLLVLKTHDRDPGAEEAFTKVRKVATIFSISFYLSAL